MRTDGSAGWAAVDPKLDLARLERRRAPVGRRLLADLRREAWADVEDLDGDGEPELVLTADGLFAVLTPTMGGRVAAFGQGRPELVGSARAAAVLALRGAERDCWQVVGLESTGRWAEAELVDLQPGSVHAGTRIRYTLRVGTTELTARLRLPWAGAVVDVCLPARAALRADGEGVEVTGSGASRTVHLAHREATLTLALPIDLD